VGRERSTNGETRTAYRILVGKPEGKRQLGRPRRRCGHKVKMDLREIRLVDKDWIHLAQDNGPVESSCKHGKGTFGLHKMLVNW
jgi:hypothetical protein